MKVSTKFLTALALVGSTSFVHADYSLVPADASELSKLCVAAASAESHAELLALTAAAGIARSELPTLRCNGMALTRFAAKYGGAKPVSLVENSSSMGYLLRKTDSSPLTELCAAAAMSDAEYAKVKSTYFSNDASIDAEVQCNGLPLKSFVRKFRSSTTALVSAR